MKAGVRHVMRRDALSNDRANPSLPAVALAKAGRITRKHIKNGVFFIYLKLTYNH
jgi:hypothetical protein